MVRLPSPCPALLAALLCLLVNAAAPCQSAFHGSVADSITQPSRTGSRSLAYFAAARGDGDGSGLFDPVASAAPGNETWDVAPAGTGHQQPLSRLGFGANVSPLGVGINATTPLSDVFDARLMGNFFTYNSPQFEIDNFKGEAHLHLASMAASLDWYPFNSIWRLSPGLMFYNSNQFSATSLIAAGKDVSFNGQDYYSASPNPATGATPLNASGALGLHRRPIAFTLAGGFGRFVPHSHRHWSFPSEFGVVFMGAPTVDMTVTGWACLDAAQTQCSNVADKTSPIAQDFNSALQAQITKWRHDVSGVTVYPMFSYSVVYSFDLP